MKAAIVYYSRHHGNTKKLLDAIAERHPVALIDVTQQPDADLSEYDRIGFASGIYYSAFAKQLVAFAKERLPEGKDVFFIYTHGAPGGSFLKSIREVTSARHSREIGEYRCQGFDTFGPFKLIGGLAKGHPTGEEIRNAVTFYEKLKS